MPGFIDPPSYYAPVEEFREFLASMKRMPPSPELRQIEQHTRRVLARKLRDARRAQREASEAQASQALISARAKLRWLVKLANRERLPPEKRRAARALSRSALALVKLREKALAFVRSKRTSR